MSEAITQTSPRASHGITSTPYSHATFPLSVPPTNQNIKSYDTHAIYAEHLTSRRTRLTFHRQFREAHTPSGQRACQSRRCQYPPSQRVRYAPRKSKGITSSTSTPSPLSAPSHTDVAISRLSLRKTSLTTICSMAYLAKWHAAISKSSSFSCCLTDSSNGRASGAAGFGSPRTTRTSSSSDNG